MGNWRLICTSKNVICIPYQSTLYIKLNILIRGIFGFRRTFLFLRGRWYSSYSILINSNQMAPTSNDQLIIRIFFYFQFFFSFFKNVILLIHSYAGNQQSACALFYLLSSLCALVFIRVCRIKFCTIDPHPQLWLF